MAAENIKDVLSSTSKLASYNMLLQLSFRILTFLLNAFTLRYISKETLGVANVRLYLLYRTILFLSREAFRRACLSKSPKRDGDSQYADEWRRMMNLLWCIIPVAAISSMFLSYLWINYLERPDPGIIPHYTTGVIIYGSSIMIEMLAEPLFIMAQALLFIKLKVLCEGIPMVFNCIATVIFVVFCPDLGILSFCIAQVIFSTTYVLILWGYFTWYIRSGNNKKYDDFPFSSTLELLPQFSCDRGTVDPEAATLVWSFFKQSGLKQILTEGEKYVMTIFNVLSFGDQGVYDVVNNLGSLAARFIFLPIEESFYVFFVKMIDRGVPVGRQNKEKIKLARHVLFCLLRLVFLIGLVILTFGYSFSFMFLNLYGGSMLSEGTGPTLLRAYSFYVLLIAVNGTTECFFFAAMSQQDVDRYNKKMLLFSIVFLASSYYLTLYFGSVGFIFANCLNMTVRIGHSINFINRYFQVEEESPLKGLTPHWIVLQCYGVVFAICGLSESFFRDFRFVYFVIGHGLVGVICMVALLAFLYTTEEKVISFLKDQYFTRKKSD